MKCAMSLVALVVFGVHKMLAVSRLEREILVSLNRDLSLHLRNSSSDDHVASMGHNDAIIPELPHLNVSTRLHMEQGSLCPELMAASRLLLSVKEPPSINMTMLQLVGQWTCPRQQNVFEAAFEHNRKVCHNNLGIPASAMTRAPSSFEMDASNTTSPAYWKMRAIRESCAAGYDVVWYLDGDVLLTDPQYPIKALWQFHHHFQPEMDILFGVDPNGINTGLFLVNCKSQTALEFLDAWHDGAPRIAKYSPTLMEQTFVQYVLESGKFWTKEIPKQRAYRMNPMPKWNDYSAKAREDPRVWSTKALRAGRLQPAYSQCSMSAYRQMRRIDLRRVWQSGDVSVHLAGSGPKDKRRYMQEYLEQLPKLTSDVLLKRPNGTTQKEVALAYLKSHEVLPAVSQES